MRNSSSIATSRSVRPTRPASSVSRKRLVGEPCRGADAVDLAGVLDRPQTLDNARARDELPLLAEQLGQARVLLDGEARVVEPQALARAVSADEVSTPTTPSSMSPATISRSNASGTCAADWVA